MYSEDLEKLIEFALADGVLTEKKKQVLFKKAEAEGIDLDEFEMVINGKFHLKQKEIQAEMKPIIQMQQPIQENAKPKEEDLIKCHSCGADLETDAEFCGNCGAKKEVLNLD